jgi:predicted DNA-binding ribbon-helix-helix protein
MSQSVAEMRVRLGASFVVTTKSCHVYVLGRVKGRQSMSRMIPRSLLIAGSKTSLRLEEAFWVGLEIADKRGMTLSDLIGTIDAQRQRGNRSSAVRVFVLEYYRNPPVKAAG